MNLSPFHIYSKARELAGYVTGEDKLLPVFASSDIRIFPYQIAAAMFALRSPYLRGVVLADEGSLGKTYEALLIATQRWYEGKDKQLVVLPTNLIKQWTEKIESGFTVPYILIDSEESFLVAESFDQHALVITTYDFAVAKAEYIAQVAWDLVIFDEASVLAKGYTGDNKTATTLKGATYNAFKLLLTPTPITMSIMDIYGLLWFIDETIVPDDKWFYERYFRKPENYGELSEWVSKYCFRTLKSQVLDYVNFSQRVPYTVGYDLTPPEKELYALVDRCLAIPQKVAYPKMEPYDLTLMFYHTLSSSAQAFCKTLEGAISRIEDSSERDLLKQIVVSCECLVVSSKMKKLLEVLKKAFKRLDQLKIEKKVVIFTDNRTTQTTLKNLLRENGYDGVLTYSGQNSRDYSLMNTFRSESEAQVLIATDDAARGLDMEFCPVVINYDLLYNAIEMEQRITRCHRQGQRSDVLVVNLLGKENFADVRILELINKRILQFEGIFGMSDDIVGNFDADIDDVLSKLRHRDTIQQLFRENLDRNKAENQQLVRSAETTLFTSFTQEVANAVTLTPEYIEDKIEAVNDTLWEVVSSYFEGLPFEIDHAGRTITALDENPPELFYYWTGTRNRPYRSLKRYGMSADFKPHTGRITLTSVIGRGVLDEVSCADYGTITVDAEIEPCTIGFYSVRVDGQEYFTFVGETESGKVLSDAVCRDIMELNVLSHNERNEEKNNQNNYNSRTFVSAMIQPFKVDTLIDTEQFIQKRLLGRDSALSEQFGVMRHKTAIAKTALERDAESLKVDIKRAEREMTEAADRLKRIQADKQLKILKNELRKKEDSIFMDRMRLDLQLEQEIEVLKSRSGLRATVQRHYLIDVIGKI